MGGTRALTVPVSISTSTQPNYSLKRTAATGCGTSTHSRQRPLSSSVRLLLLFKLRQ